MYCIIRSRHNYHNEHAALQFVCIPTHTCTMYFTLICALVWNDEQ